MIDEEFEGRLSSLDTPMEDPDMDTDTYFENDSEGVDSYYTQSDESLYDLLQDASDESIDELLQDASDEADDEASEEDLAETVTQGKKPKKNKKGKKNKADKKAKKNRKRFFTFSKKLVMLCILPMILVCTVTVFISANSLKSGIESEIQKSLKIVASTLDETYSNLYEGDYHKAFDGAISKGDKKISGDTKLIKSIKENTGFEATMFWEDSRLISTIKKENGMAANGTRLDKEIYAQITEGEGQELFIKGMDILGTVYYVFYQPLKNSDGSVIGAFGVALDSASVQSTINSQIIKLVVVSILIMIVVAVIIVLMSRKMVTTMKKTKDFLGNIADGDLTIIPEENVLKRNDELGDIYSMSVQLQTELRKIVNHIKDSVEDLNHSANTLTDMAQETKGSVDVVIDAVEEISKGTVTQAEGTSSANSNVEMIGRQIEYISDEVDSLTKHAGQMSEAEKYSEQIIVELNESSEDTKASINRVSEEIVVLNKLISGIHSAVALIQSIADETDLLSLNASIEAARAGEAGRGFVVVAEQICKLADQSNKSAKEIDKIITEVTAESQHMVEIMGEVSANMDHQQTKLEETKTTYRAVAEGIEKSLANINHIKNQMGVLNNSGNVIRGVVEDLSVISDQNANSVQSTMGSAEDMSTTMNELENSSEKLLMLADRLNDALTIFKI